MSDKTNIREYSKKQLLKIASESGQPEFRANQLYEWIWKKSVTDFDLMSSLPLDFRNHLKEKYAFESIKVVKTINSSDGCLKYLFSTPDDLYFEGVLIPSGNRATICISTQLGCSLGCKFCATAAISLKRNLHFWEIYDQVAILNKESEKISGHKVTNIVVMGMGEPLLNYENLLNAIQIITSPAGLGFSPQRITVSTAGIPEMIRKLADNKVKFNLAFSINSAINVKRTTLMPVNKKFNLDQIKPALKYYFEKTRNLITLEYIVIKGFNDTNEDISALKKFTRELPVKINLIEYNPVTGSTYVSPSLKDMLEFKTLLEEQNYIVNVRRSRGRDIDAACGQLAAKH
jgi:23S rRNA (adenine2503-C2)-methyltransferase